MTSPSGVQETGSGTSGSCSTPGESAGSSPRPAGPLPLAPGSDALACLAMLFGKRHPRGRPSKPFLLCSRREASARGGFGGNGLASITESVGV